MNALSFLDEYRDQNILICPLNWGLGHTTRCIPIIKTLKDRNTVMVASDGLSLTLLQKEFPQLKSFELPSYNISYGDQNSFFWHLAKKGPSIALTISKELAEIERLVEAHQISMIISDHRLGCNSTLCTSVIVAHQLYIVDLPWWARSIANRTNRYFINQFDQCWIPDYEKESMSLSGELSQTKNKIKNYKYIGPLSRCKKLPVDYSIDVLVLLSGPEPARSKLEYKLFQILAPPSDFSIVMIRGTTDKPQHSTESIITYDMVDSMTTNALINKSKIIICRSGYSSLMDLESLGKKAILIPTPGQTEQEYLAEFLCSRDRYTSIKENNLSNKTLYSAIKRLLVP